MSPKQGGGLLSTVPQRLMSLKYQNKQDILPNISRNDSITIDVFPNISTHDGIRIDVFPIISTNDGIRKDNTVSK